MISRGFLLSFFSGSGFISQNARYLRCIVLGVQRSQELFRASSGWALRFSQLPEGQRRRVMDS